MIARQLQIFRNDPFGVMLLLLVEDYENRVLAAYREHGFADVMRSHGAVLRYLGEQGARITEIAERAGITKQTVGRIVRDLEHAGYVQVVPGSHDRRVRRVTFSPRGQTLVNTSRTIVSDIRETYGALMGTRDFRQLERLLEQTVSLLGKDLSFLEAADHSSRFYHFGRLLVELAEDFEQRLLAALPATERDLISTPMRVLFSQISDQGNTVTELAKNLPITVQAVSLTVRKLVARSILDVRESPNDSRAKSVRLSVQGQGLLTALNQACARVRFDYSERLGRQTVGRLEQLLGQLFVSLTAAQAEPSLPA